MSRWQKGFCNVCGRRLSIYNTGAQCFFHSIPDRSQNLISEESYSPVKYVDPGDGSHRVRISEGGVWRISANRMSE